MSTRDASNSGGPWIGTNPPNAAYWERWKLAMMAGVAAAPLGLVIVHVGLGALSSTDDTRNIALIVLGLVAAAFVGAQIVTLLVSRSSFTGDRVNIDRIGRTKRVMTWLSVPILILAPVVGVIGVAFLSVFGLLSFVMAASVGVFGMLGRYRLQKIERFFANGVPTVDEASRGGGRPLPPPPSPAVPPPTWGMRTPDSPLSTSTRCPRCGATPTPGARFCAHCGGPLG